MVKNTLFPRFSRGNFIKANQNFKKKIATQKLLSDDIFILQIHGVTKWKKEIITY